MNLLPLQTMGSCVIDTNGLNKQDRKRIREVGLSKWMDEVKSSHKTARQQRNNAICKQETPSDRAQHVPEQPKRITRVLLTRQVSKGRLF